MVPGLPTNMKPDDNPQLDEGVRRLADPWWTWRLPWAPTTPESPSDLWCLVQQEVNLGVASKDVSVQSCRGWSPVQLLVRTRPRRSHQECPWLSSDASRKHDKHHQNLTLSVIVFSLSIVYFHFYSFGLQPNGIKASHSCCNVSLVPDEGE